MEEKGSAGEATRRGGDGFVSFVSSRSSGKEERERKEMDEVADERRKGEAYHSTGMKRKRAVLLFLNIKA